MPVSAVVGANWGDEGKGRLVDYLAARSDFVVRFQGGNNAGHTVHNDQGVFKLHLVPSGVFYPEVTNLLGPGVVVDLGAFATEVAELEAGGVDTSRVLVSDRASVVFPFHRELDRWEEERLGGRQMGSTKRGIAPAYGDRYLRKAVLVGELLEPRDRMVERVRSAVDWASLLATGVYHRPPIDLDEVLAWVDAAMDELAPRVVDTTSMLREALAGGRRVLLEAQLGALRDLVYGIYPYTSSSNCLAAFGPIGAGIPGAKVDRVIGVVKAFSTSIGSGPFVTEIHGDDADRWRVAAGEYGAATGRPRRIGHFDAFATGYGLAVQGATEVALTKLDSLSGREKLRICTGYLVDGEPARTFPLASTLDRAEPVYETLPGWGDDIQAVRDFADLPQEARDYVDAIAALVGPPIRLISVGPERDQMIVMKAPR